MTLYMLVSVFGWMTLINGGLLLLATLALYAMRPTIIPIHQSVADLDASALNRAYFSYLSQFKLLWIFLNFAPWLALVIVT